MYGNASVENVTIHCEGESDDSTPVKYTWQFNDRTLPAGAPIITSIDGEHSASLFINLNGVPIADIEKYKGEWTEWRQETLTMFPMTMHL